MKKILLLGSLILIFCSANSQTAPLNDLFAGATPVSCGQTITGSTTFASNVNETNLPFCSTGSGMAKGVWYVLTGSLQGEGVAVNTCLGTTYDSKIDVFSYSNGNLACVGGNDDWCSLQSRVEFTSNGGTYYIYVHGFYNPVTQTAAFGSFVLRVACVKISGNPIICKGLSNILHAGPNYTSYHWSTNETTESISINTTGTFAVTVTDQNGSVVNDSIITMVVDTPPSAITPPSLYFCEGNSATICAPPSQAHYQWSEGQTTPCLNSGIPGVYNLTVTDTNGCVSRNHATLYMNLAPDCSISGVLNACGSTTTLFAPPHMSYLWSTHQTTNPITVNAAGLYSVTIRNDSGCTSTCSETVTLHNAPDVNAGGDKFLDCQVTTAVLNGSSVTPNVTYNWTTSNGGNILSGGNTPSPTVDYTGTYTLIVTNPVGACTSADAADVFALPPVPCTTCNGNVIVVNQNVTINFNVNPPAYSGDADLLPFFAWDRSGTNPALWKAIFNLGPNKLLVQNGATIKTLQVGTATPGIAIQGSCGAEVENGGHILVVTSGIKCGDIVINVNGTITVNGEIRNEITGEQGLPGRISLNSTCGDVVIGSTGLLQDVGEDDGAAAINIQACGSDCNFYGSGNITIAGLVQGYAEGTPSTSSLNRPDIKVISLNGFVTINANSVEPLYDDYAGRGSKADLYGGLLSWVDQNSIPGKINVQARKTITVNGHGTDPTGAVNRSFAAITSAGFNNSTAGGIIDVRSLDGSIVADNRAFEVAGKNSQYANIAAINLFAKGNVLLSRSGANNNFNPVLNASSPNNGGKGGTNTVRSYSGKIIIGANASISASVPPGSGSLQGINLLQSCTGVINSGTVIPPDLIAGDDIGSCSPVRPLAAYSACSPFLRLADPEPGEVSMEGLTVYPNPTSGKISLRFSSTGTEKYSALVYSVTGNIVISETAISTEGMNEKELDLSGLAKGMYFLVFESNSVKEEKKIIVQ